MTIYAAKMKCKGVTKTVYTGNTEVHEDVLTCGSFTGRFQDCFPDRLSVGQSKDEGKYSCWQYNMVVS